MKGDARRYADILPRYTALRIMLASAAKQAKWELAAEDNLCRCDTETRIIHLAGKYTCIHHKIIAWNANYEDDEHES